jgi:hypothetical protein
MKILTYTKSAVLVIYWGLRSLKLYFIIGLSLILFSGMVSISIFSPENPIKLICGFLAVFSLWFGNYLILKR